MAVATIFISRYTLRFRGLDNAEKVIRGFLPRPAADRDKSERAGAVTPKSKVVFSQDTTRSSRANNDVDNESVHGSRGNFRPEITD